MVTTLCAAPDLRMAVARSRMRLIGGNAFAVRDPDLLELPREIAVHVNSGDDERAEEVALAAFVDAEVRLEHFGIEHLLVAELGFAENVRLQAKAHKVFGAPALNHRFRTFFVNGDRQLVLLRKVERVGTRFELVSFLPQQELQFRGLRGRQRSIVKGDGFVGHGTNQ